MYLQNDAIALFVASQNVCVHVYVHVYVRVFVGSKIRGSCGNCEKGKVKESERRMSTSVMKTFSAFVHG